MIWRIRLRAAVLVLVLLWLPEPGFAQSHIANKAGFDPRLVESVIGTALDFLRPRTLEAYSARQLTVWGLNGLTAIDPSLTVEAHSDSPHGDFVRLVTPDGLLYAEKAPAEADSAGWAQTAGSMAQAAWNNSAQIRKAGQQALVQSFFDELFNHLDPYSRYIAPAPASSERTNRIGAIASAGITITKVGTKAGTPSGVQTGARAGRTTLITAVNANGPAWAAGISPGMRLLAVDGQATRNQDEATIAGWLEGAEGSPVILLLAPEEHTSSGRPASGRLAEQSITLTRMAVPPETVFAFSSGDVVVLRLTGFSADTAQEMSQFLDQVMQPADAAGKASSIHGLIVDLRGNRGGLLQQAVTSIALVLDHGVAVVTRGRAPQSNHVWSVRGGDLTGGLPVVVLVDGRTASAAEIMAASLADHRRAVVLGSATLGKGLVQTIAQLPDGGELFVTWSRVIAPLGWPLQGLGVMPQLCTSLGQAALDRALADLSDGIQDNARAIQQSRAARSPLPTARILEIRNACPAAIGGDADLDAARLLIEDPVSYRTALIPDTLAPMQHLE